MKRYLCALGVICALMPRAVLAQTTVLGQMARTYRITIVADKPVFPVKCTYGVIGGREARAKARLRYAALFAREFGHYPTGLVQKTQLRRVVLCRDLAFNGQKRSAIPDFEHDTLYLDVERGANNPEYVRRVLHHEFFHLIDYRDDGRVYDDAAWAALNPPGFRYGSGGSNAQKLSQTSLYTATYPGFLNHYATTGVEEDKAELFAALLTAPDYVARRAAGDRVLKAKVARLKTTLRAFCPAAEDAFWKSASSPKKQTGRKRSSPPARLA